MKGRQGVWLVMLTGVMASVMFISGCSGDKGAEQEQVSVREQFAQLEATHDARYEMLQGLEDTDLARLLWEEQRSNYFTMLNLIPFHMHPEDFQYTQPHLRHLHAYDDMAAMTEAYLESLVAINSHDHLHCMRYSGDHGFSLEEGFEFPFRYRQVYLQMAFDDGTTVDIPNLVNQQETADIIHQGGSYCYKTPFTEDDPQPSVVRGEFYAELPEQLLEFEFTAADIGKTLEQEGYLVTVLEFEQGRYAIEIDAVEGNPINFGNRDVIAEAVDGHGQYLAWYSTKREPTNRAQRIHQLLGDLFQRAEQGTVDSEQAHSELLALRDTLLNEQGDKLFLGRAFHGMVDKARVTLMVYPDESESLRRELELPVQNFPRSQVASEANLNALPQIPLTAPVYNTRSELSVPIVELDKQQMQTRMKMIQWHDGFEDPDVPRDYSGEVSWFYPPVQSDLFMGRRDRAGALHVLGEFEFYNAQGEPVEVRQASEPDSQQPAFEYKPGNLQLPTMIGRVVYSPERFSEPPVGVKGTLPMIVAPNLIKDSYGESQLPAGMTLNGNQLMIDYAVFEPREVVQVRDEYAERRNQVFVKDSQGYLAEIKKVTLFHPSSGRTAVDVYYFYGEPETVEIWYKGETTLVNYEFDVELVSDDIQAN